MSEPDLKRVELIHKKFCHLSYKNLRILFPHLKVPIGKICEICLKAKQAHKKLNKEKVRVRSTKLLEIVHTDVDEMPITSVDGEKYFVTFIEESTHFITLFITLFNLKRKSKVQYYYKAYENRMINQCTSTGISILYCDNGGEYMSLTNSTVTRRLTGPFCTRLLGTRVH